MKARVTPAEDCTCTPDQQVRGSIMRGCPVHDVPPDPPAADVVAPEFVKFRDEQLKDPEVREAYERARLRNEMAVVIHATRKPECECGDFATKDEDIAAALLSSGVLVYAADVRARASEREVTR